MTEVEIYQSVIFVLLAVQVLTWLYFALRKTFLVYVGDETRCRGFVSALTMSGAFSRLRLLENCNGFALNRDVRLEQIPEVDRYDLPNLRRCPIAGLEDTGDWTPAPPPLPRTESLQRSLERNLPH